VNVLFVGRENTARSLMAEACLRHLGKNRFQVYSCGVPSLTLAKPNDWALLALQTAGISSEGLRCKDWIAFAKRGATPMDFVISLDASVKQAHPAWPGQPELALWSYPPLIKQKGQSSTALGLAALQTLHSLRLRLELLVSLHSKARSAQDLRHDLRDLAHL
jgi:arsenate reductase